MTPMTRFLLPALAAALLAAGCGSGDSTQMTAPEESGAETTQAEQSEAEGPAGATARLCRSAGEDFQLLRVTGVSCSKGEGIASLWRASPDCAPTAGESRSACTVGGFRCLTTVVDRGLAATCARPERSIAFITKRPG
jgi:hypothetical protein